MRILFLIIFCGLFSISVQANQDCKNILDPSSGKFKRICDNEKNIPEVTPIYGEIFTGKEISPKPAIQGYDKSWNFDYLTGKMDYGAPDKYARMANVCFKSKNEKEVFIKKGKYTFDVLIYCNKGKNSPEHIAHLRGIFDSRADKYCTENFYRYANYRGMPKLHHNTFEKVNYPYTLPSMGSAVGASYVCDYEEDQTLAVKRIEKERKIEEEKQLAALKKKEADQRKLNQISEMTDLELCEELIAGNGYVIKYHKDYEILNEVQVSRNLSNEDCNIISGRFTKEQKKIIAEIEKEKKAEQLKQQRISSMKKDCKDLGFTEGTEAMGNCVLKLMELEKKSAPQVVTTNIETSNDNAMLEIERAKLKAEQERLEVEKQRAWIERQEQLNRIGTQSMEKGWCLMNGGGWGC